MFDRIVTGLLNGLVLGMIVATAAAGLALIFAGTIHAVAEHVAAGVTWIVAGHLLSGGCYLLCRNKADLTYG